MFMMLQTGIAYRYILLYTSFNSHINPFRQ